MEKQMVIMLVDDEERFLSTSSKLITRMGYSVLTASGGAEALEKLRLKRHFNAVRIWRARSV